MTDGKHQIIQQRLQEEYDIEIAKDIWHAHKDLFCGAIKEITEDETDDYLGYEIVIKRKNDFNGY